MVNHNSFCSFWRIKHPCLKPTLTFTSLLCEYPVIWTTCLYLLHIPPVARCCRQILNVTSHRVSFTELVLFPRRGCDFFRPRISHGWDPYVGSIWKLAGSTTSNGGLWTGMESSEIRRHGDARQTTAQIHRQIKKKKRKKVTDTERDPAVSITLRLSKRRMQREKWD